MANATGGRKLATLNEAATYCGVSTRTIRRYIAAGRIRAYRCGPKLIKLDVADLDQLLSPIPTTRAA